METIKYSKIRVLNYIPKYRIEYKYNKKNRYVLGEFLRTDCYGGYDNLLTFDSNTICYEGGDDMNIRTWSRCYCQLVYEVFNFTFDHFNEEVVQASMISFLSLPYIKRHRISLLFACNNYAHINNQVTGTIFQRDEYFKEAYFKDNFRTRYGKMNGDPPKFKDILWTEGDMREFYNMTTLFFKQYNEDYRRYWGVNTSPEIILYYIKYEGDLNSVYEAMRAYLISSGQYRPYEWFGCNVWRIFRENYQKYGKFRIKYDYNHWDEPVYYWAGNPDCLDLIYDYNVNMEAYNNAMNQRIVLFNNSISDRATYDGYHDDEYPTYMWFLTNAIEKAHNKRIMEKIEEQDRKAYYEYIESYGIDSDDY